MPEVRKQNLTARKGSAGGLWTAVCWAVRECVHFLLLPDSAKVHPSALSHSRLMSIASWCI